MSSLPDILKVQPLPSIENMPIQTEVLDPITITDRTCVFQLGKNGILDAGSFVQLGVTCSADGEFFFPISTGVHALIESVVLKVGNKVVASNSRYPYFTTATRQFDSPEHRAFVDMIKSGTCGDRFASAENGRIAYRDLITTLDTTTPADSTALVPTIIKPTTSDDTTPLFSVPLSTLIPMMRSRQLPLFAMKEHVYIEITFAQQTTAADIGTICCRSETSTASPLISVSKPNIKFIFDSLYYTDDAMNKVMGQVASSSGLTILYEDQIVTDAAVPAVTSAGDQKVERDVAVAGRTVRSLLIHDKPSSEVHTFLGKYVSRDTLLPSSLNFRINDQRLYDRDIVDPTRKYDELAMVMGRPLMVPSQVYSYDADTDDIALNQNSAYIGKVEGHSCPDASNTNAFSATDFRGTSHYEGVDLTTSGFNTLGNGMKIGVNPIRVLKTYKRTAQDLGTRDMKVFASVERLFLLKQGEVVVSS